MFGDALPRETLEDVYVQCGRSVDAAVEALLALSMAEPRERAPSGGGVDGAVVGVIPTPAPSRASRPDPSAPDLWDALPVELRLPILDRLGSREAARAARVCRDFASTVRAATSRAGSRLPPRSLRRKPRVHGRGVPQRHVHLVSSLRSSRVDRLGHRACSSRGVGRSRGGLHRVRGPRGMRRGRARRGPGRAPRRRQGRGGSTHNRVETVEVRRGDG